MTEETRAVHRAVRDKEGDEVGVFTENPCWRVRSRREKLRDM